MPCFLRTWYLPVLRRAVVAAVVAAVAAVAAVAVVVTASTSNTETVYKRGTLCELSAKLSIGCMSVVNDVTVRSLVECTSICSKVTTCSGVSWNKQIRTCFLHHKCLPDTSCIHQHNSSNDLVSFKKVPTSCQNGGLFRLETKTCLCNDGWVGDECERYPYTCNELYDGEYGSRPGVSSLDLYRDQSKIVRTNCVHKYNQVSTNILNTNGKRQHNMSYEDFVSGYFMNKKNYWIGLDHARYLNQRGFGTVRLTVTFIDNGVKSWFTWTYFGFHIGPPSDGYPISYTNSEKGEQGQLDTDFNMTLTNCFENISGVSFSAWDHETTGSNCAGRHGAGWWYPDDCHAPCRLQGVQRNRFPGLGEEEYVTIPGLNLDEETVEERLYVIVLYFSS